MITDLFPLVERALLHRNRLIQEAAKAERWHKKSMRREVIRFNTELLDIDTEMVKVYGFGMDRIMRALRAARAELYMKEAA